jgi:hypothetical protein
MRKAIFSLGLMLLMVGCTEHPAGHSESEQRAANERNKADSTVPASPEFSVNVRLSDAAKKKLVDSKETIIVAGYFTGHPKQGTERRYLDIKSRQVDLGDVEVEIHADETATFNDLKLKPDALARIDSGPSILISVFSGRKSSKDNLLSCGDYDGSFESIHGRTIDISCRLIEEEFPRQGN